MVKKKVTLEDVARRAGCSKAAVSYVINRRKPIGESLRKRILEAIEYLHYQPSGIRRAQEQCRAIGVLVRGDIVETTSHYMALNRRILAQDFIPQFYFFPRAHGEVERIMRLIAADRKVAGLINTLPDVGSVDMLKWARETPSVIYVRENCMLSPVRFRYDQRMEISIEHLFQLGHRRVFFLIEQATLKRDLIVRNIEVMSRYRLKTADRLSFEVVAHPYERDNAKLFPKLDALRGGGYTGAIAWNGFFASMLYHWALARGFRIGADFSVVGFEDPHMAESMAPTLTTVSLPNEDLAHHTVEMLVAKIRNRVCREITLFPQLRVGGSTGPNAAPRATTRPGI